MTTYQTELIFEGKHRPAPPLGDGPLLCSSRRNLFLRREEEQCRERILLEERHTRHRNVESVIGGIEIERAESERKCPQHLKKLDDLENREVNARVLSVEVKERSRRFDIRLWYQRSTEKATLTLQQEPVGRSAVLSFESRARLALEIQHTKISTAILSWTGVLTCPELLESECSDRSNVTSSHYIDTLHHQRLALTLSALTCRSCIANQYFGHQHTLLVSCVIYNFIPIIAAEEATAYRNLLKWNSDTIDIKIWNLTTSEYDQRILIEEAAAVVPELSPSSAPDEDEVTSKRDEEGMTSDNIITTGDCMDTPELCVETGAVGLLSGRAITTALLRMQAIDLLSECVDDSVQFPHQLLDCVSPSNCERRGLLTLTNTMSGSLALCCSLSRDQPPSSLSLVASLYSALKHDLVIDRSIRAPAPPDLQTYQRVVNFRTKSEVSSVPFKIMFDMEEITTEAEMICFDEWCRKSMDASKELVVIAKQRKIISREYLSLLVTECRRLEDECLAAISSAAEPLRALLAAENELWLRKYSHNYESQIHALTKSITLYSYSITSHAALICSRWTMHLPGIEADAARTPTTSSRPTSVSDQFQLLWAAFVSGVDKIRSDFVEEHPDTSIDTRSIADREISQMNIFRHKLWWDWVAG